MNKAIAPLKQGITKGLQPLRRGLTARARTLAYSDASRRMARRLVEDPSAERFRTEIEKRGHGAKLRRLASQPLPTGTYFAKLTIHRWKQHQNKSFRLLEGDRVVYGNKIEPPARGFELEYRNIIVTSDDPADFRLDINADYTLLIGRGAFTTAQQVRYDEQYGVEQHGDLFYSVRGNTVNPSRVLITFPGFGPSTSRISYAVSYLKAITDEDLSDTLMICFQDRYMVAGTYMIVDNAGDPLHGRVHAEITGLLEKYGIPEDQLMLFGASKGGSIATYFAEGFPAARLLAVVPQMNLPYYLDKPFFRENIYRLPQLRAEPQPGDLMRRYFAEGRKIDYFYTDRDEQSNYSLIEFVQDVPGLTKYRVDGNHSDVAKKALPTILTVMKRFLRGEPEVEADQEIPCEQVVTFPDDKGVGFQVRLGNDAGLTTGATTNVLLEVKLGRTVFRQLISDHTYGFIKYTAPTERVLPALHSPADIHGLLHTTSSGALRRGCLPTAEPLPLSPSSTEDTASADGLTAPLDLTPSQQARRYSVLAATNLPVSTFEYTVQAGSADGDTALVFLVPNGVEPVLDTSEPTAEDLTVEEPRVVVTATLAEGTQGIALFAHRIAITADVESIHVVVADPAVTNRELTALRRLYGPQVVCDDRRPAEETLLSSTETA